MVSLLPLPPWIKRPLASGWSTTRSTPHPCSSPEATSGASSRGWGNSALQGSAVLFVPGPGPNRRRPIPTHFDPTSFSLTNGSSRGACVLGQHITVVRVTKQQGWCSRIEQRERALGAVARMPIRGPSRCLQRRCRSRELVPFTKIRGRRQCCHLREFIRTVPRRKQLCVE